MLTAMRAAVTWDYMLRIYTLSSPRENSSCRMRPILGLISTCLPPLLMLNVVTTFLDQGSFKIGGLILAYDDRALPFEIRVHLAGPLISSFACLNISLYFDTLQGPSRLTIPTDRTSRKSKLET